MALWLLNGMVSFRYTKLPDGIFDAGGFSPPNSWNSAIFRKRSSATLHQEGCNVHKNHRRKTGCCSWSNSRKTHLFKFVDGKHILAGLAVVPFVCFRLPCPHWCWSLWATWWTDSRTNTLTWSSKSIWPQCSCWPHCKYIISLNANGQDLTIFNFSFIGINQTLPSTSYIKMIDIWMVFTMICPFSEIVLAWLNDIAQNNMFVLQG